MAPRTKIVCTIGPASSTPETIRALILSGMNVARLNMSHGNHEDHSRRFESIRAIAAELDQNVAILIDLQGPKIRTGTLRDGNLVFLNDGADFTMTTEQVEGSAERVSTTYQSLPTDVHPGDRILMADGTMELRVLEVNKSDVKCTVVRGGWLGEHKGINLPGVQIAEPSMSEKDRDDLELGIALGADYVALSFVRRAEDLHELRALLDAAGASMGVVSKIERPEAVKHFDQILALSDAIMLARGDLGVEVDFEQVPIIQKSLIRQCNARGVPVITATQMLESMLTHARPTRAEVADVANAIYDGTDAVMLSGETASGEFPVESCRVMARIAQAIDEDMEHPTAPEMRLRQRAIDGKATADRVREPQNIYADAIGQAVCRMAETLDIAHIVCFTTSGYTARAIARYRPKSSIVAITNNDATRRRCALYWATTAIRCEDFNEIGALVGRVETLLVEHRLAMKGETVIIAAGTPLVIGGRTNLLKLHTVGDPVE